MVLANNKLLTAADKFFTLKPRSFTIIIIIYIYEYSLKSSKTQPPLTIVFNTSIYNLGLSSIVIMQIITVHENKMLEEKRGMSLAQVNKKQK